MREIKFKGWNGKRMTREYTLNEMLVQQLEFNGLKENWLQYTGLKDLNGVKIYEGDIIHKSEKWGTWSVDYASFGNPRFDVWNQLNSIRDIEIIDEIATFSPTNESIEIEVIGNIYQNPELLK